MVDMNSQRNQQKLVYSLWLTFPTLNSSDSSTEDGERLTSTLPLDYLQFQELGWPREISCGGKQKSQPALEQTSFKQRHNPDPHGPCGEVAEPLTHGVYYGWADPWKQNSTEAKHHFILLKTLDNQNVCLVDTDEVSASSLELLGLSEAESKGQLVGTWRINVTVGSFHTLS